MGHHSEENIVCIPGFLLQKRLFSVFRHKVHDQQQQQHRRLGILQVKTFSKKSGGFTEMHLLNFAQ